MDEFYLARIWCPVVWSNTSVDIGVKVICGYNSVNDIIVHNVGGPQSNHLKASTAKIEIPGKKVILLQDCIIEILPEFLVCCPVLEILESRLQH